VGSVLTDGAPPLTSADLDAVEGLLGVVLPADLRAHYLRWNGGVPVAACWVVDDEVVAEIAEFRPMRYGDGEPYDTVEDWYAAFVREGHLPAGVLPFAHDWGGAAFCLDLTTQDVELHRFDTDVAPVRVLTRGFATFLAGLVPAEAPDA
jgi:cell wall assembly regulator SMI1